MQVKLYPDYNAWRREREAIGSKLEGETTPRQNLRAIRVLQTIPVFRASENYRQSAGYDAYVIICPGCGHQGELPIEPALGARHAWRISGLPDAVTISPSVHCHCSPAGHFWVENGQYRQA